jgi:hypothetical protein
VGPECGRVSMRRRCGGGSFDTQTEEDVAVGPLRQRLDEGSACSWNRPGIDLPLGSGGSPTPPRAP